MKRVLQFIAACLPMVFCMLLIFYFSSQNADASTVTSGRFIARILSALPFGFDEMSTPEKLIMIDEAQFFVRKAAHFSIYGLLGPLAMLPLHVLLKSWKRSAFAAWCALLLFSVSDEIHQMFVPGRSGELRDVLIDTAGAALGIFLFYKLICLWKKRTKNNKNNI